MGSDWIYSTILLSLVLLSWLGYDKLKHQKIKRALYFEKFKNKELLRKLTLAQKKIRNLETDPDLVHSREFNLDDLRLRMDEEIFDHSIMNQIRLKIQKALNLALSSDNGIHKLVCCVVVIATERKPLMLNMKP